MDGLSKTDEVLALLNKRERGEGSRAASAPAAEDTLGFTDFLPSPAAAVLHKLQRISAQPRSEQPVSVPLNSTPSDALKVVLGEQRSVEPRKLRCDSSPCHGSRCTLTRLPLLLLFSPYRCIVLSAGHCKDMSVHPKYNNQALLVKALCVCRRSTASFRRKLFGHEQQEGYNDNIITQDQSKDHVRVHPLSAFKRYWDLAIVIMVAYTVVALPVRCAFSWDYYHALDAGHNIFHQLAVRLKRDLFLGPICYIGLPVGSGKQLGTCSSMLRSS